MKPCTAARRGGAHGCVCASVLAVRALYRGMAGAGTRGMPEGRGGEIERERKRRRKKQDICSSFLFGGRRRVGGVNGKMYNKRKRRSRGVPGQELGGRWKTATYVEVSKQYLSATSTYSSKGIRSPLFWRSLVDPIQKWEP